MTAAGVVIDTSGARATAGIPRRPWRRCRSAVPETTEPGTLRTADSQPRPHPARPHGSPPGAAPELEF